MGYPNFFSKNIVDLNLILSAPLEIQYQYFSHLSFEKLIDMTSVCKGLYVPVISYIFYSKRSEAQAHRNHLLLAWTKAPQRLQHFHTTFINDINKKEQSANLRFWVSMVSRSLEQLKSTHDMASKFSHLCFLIFLGAEQPIINAHFRKIFINRYACDDSESIVRHLKDEQTLQIESVETLTLEKVRDFDKAIAITSQYLHAESDEYFEQLEHLSNDLILQECMLRYLQSSYQYERHDQDMEKNPRNTWNCVFKTCIKAFNRKFKLHQGFVDSLIKAVYERAETFHGSNIYKGMAYFLSFKLAVDALDTMIENSSEEQLRIFEEKFNPDNMIGYVSRAHSNHFSCDHLLKAKNSPVVLTNLYFLLQVRKKSGKDTRDIVCQVVELVNRDQASWRILACIFQCFRTVPKNLVDLMLEKFKQRRKNNLCKDFGNKDFLYCITMLMKHSTVEDKLSLFIGAGRLLNRLNKSYHKTKDSFIYDGYDEFFRFVATEIIGAFFQKGEISRKELKSLDSMVHTAILKHGATHYGSEDWSSHGNLLAAFSLLYNIMDKDQACTFIVKFNKTYTQFEFYQPVLKLTAACHATLKALDKLTHSDNSKIEPLALISEENEASAHTPASGPFSQ